MDMRFLGRSGLQVSVFGFGVITFGSGAQSNPHANTQVEDARKLIDLALDAGVNLFDTADIYSNGQSEEILGEALRGRRNQACIATKVFGRMGDGPQDIGLSRQHIIQACEASLRRLGTDWIDIYQTHNHDRLVPIEETLRAFDDLIHSGKARYIGCSNYYAWEMSRALAASERQGFTRYVSHQIQYSLLVRHAETEILPACVEQGVGTLIWGPLAAGYLTGKYIGDGRDNGRLNKTDPHRLAALDDERGRQVVAVLKEIAGAEAGRSPAQVALNWLRRRPGVTSILVGAHSNEQLRDNLKASTWSLTDDELAALDAVSATPPGYPATVRSRFFPERNPVRQN